MIYNVLAIILQAVQIKLNNCASVSKSCYISTAKRITVGSFLINRKKNPFNIQNPALSFRNQSLQEVWEGGGKSKVFQPKLNKLQNNKNIWTYL